MEVVPVFEVVEVDGVEDGTVVGATNCAEMAAFVRSKEHVFRDFLKLKHSISSHDTFSTLFRMINPIALDAAFGRVLA